MGFSHSDKHATTTDLLSNIVDADSGSFVTSLTISGVPVATGTGGGASNIDDINNISSGSITITGTGSVSTITEGNVITVSGAEAGFSQAIVKIDTLQATSNSATKVVAWDSVVSDTDGWADLGTDNEVLTVPAGLGITHVRVYAQVTWASNGTGRRIVGFTKNGAALDLTNTINRTSGAGVSAGASDVTYQVISPTVAASPGDEFGVEVFQNSGGDLNITDATGDASTWFAIEQANAGITISTGGGGGGSAGEYIHVVDQKPHNTAGGTFTSGADRTRTLNTIKTDETGEASLSSNQLTIPAGKYRCRIISPAVAVSRNISWLYNITDSATELEGMSCYSGPGGVAYGGEACQIIGQFTIASAKTFEVRARCETTRATFGFGVENAQHSAVETYTVIELWRLEL